MNNFNIIDFISNNPILRLTKSCNNKLLIKIKETFTNFEQQLFINSFYCYLNYNNSNDFVIDLDNIWKWLGYSIKHNAKTTIEKFFKENIDYKIIYNNKLAPEGPGASCKTINNHGGNNRQIIMLNVKCFKSLCLKSRTDKANQIHDYYIKLEELINKTIEEETDELRLQLKQKDEIILEVKEESEYQKQKAVEDILFSLFPINTECIYIGTIQNSNEENETLIKFGHSNDLHKRVLEHRKTYNNFILIKAFKVQNKVEIENLIKSHIQIKPQIRTIYIDNKKKTELISYNDKFTINNIIQYIQDIINSKTYSIDNFNKLLKNNEDLIKENENLHIKLKDNNTELTKYILENNELKNIILEKDKLLKIIEEENKSPYNELILEDTLTKSFNEFINSMCIIHNEVEDSSTNLEGQYRIWCKIKPKKETFHAFKNYLDTRFKPIRLKEQTKNQIVYGYKGCKLKELEYKKKYISNDTENFLFQVCKFCPSGKILNSKLLEEYIRWKKSLNKEINNNEIKEIKEYLNNCDYVLKSTVWTDYGSNEGYYGLILKEDEYKHKTTSSTGKQVQKKEISTNIILGKWETIAKAAQSENLSASKMSRSIKNNIIFDNKYIYELC